jgi:hypothetical protein
VWVRKGKRIKEMERKSRMVKGRRRSGVRGGGVRKLGGGKEEEDREKEDEMDRKRSWSMKRKNRK